MASEGKDAADASQALVIGKKREYYTPAEVAMHNCAAVSQKYGSQPFIPRAKYTNSRVIAFVLSRALVIPYRIAGSQFSAKCTS